MKKARTLSVEVINRDEQTIASFSKESKWTHTQMSAWVRRKYRGQWQRVIVKG